MNSGFGTHCDMCHAELEDISIVSHLIVDKGWVDIGAHTFLYGESPRGYTSINYN